MTLHTNQNFHRVREWAAKKMTFGAASYYWFRPLNQSCTDWRGGWSSAPFQGYVLDLTDNKIYDNWR